MPREALTHSQSLRVIGQRLHGIHVHAFELVKERDEYVVQTDLDPDPAHGKASTCDVASDGIRPICFDGHPGEISLSFTFTPTELLCYDEAEKLRRIKPSVLPNIGHLSVALRVLGDYLDRRAADKFAILWSKDSVKICFACEEQILTAQNLYDLGIVMYLRGSSDVPVEVLPAECESTAAIGMTSPQDVGPDTESYKADGT